MIAVVKCAQVVARLCNCVVIDHNSVVELVHHCLSTGAVKY